LKSPCLESKLFNLLKKNNYEIFTSHQAATLLNRSLKSINDLLYHLTLKGKIYRVEKGLYLSPDFYKELSVQNEQKTAGALKLIIASKVISPYFIGYLTALKFYNNEADFSSITICSNKRKRNFKVFDTEFKFTFVNSSLWFGITSVKIKNYKLNITDIEKTILDCLAKFYNKTEISLLIEFFKKIEPDLNYRRLTNYVLNYPVKLLPQRLIWLLNKAGVNEKVIKDIAKKTGLDYNFLYLKLKKKQKKKQSFRTKKEKIGFFIDNDIFTHPEPRHYSKKIVTDLKKLLECHKVVIIKAPFGYGKTSVVSGYLSRELDLENIIYINSQYLRTYSAKEFILVLFYFLKKYMNLPEFKGDLNLLNVNSLIKLFKNFLSNENLIFIIDDFQKIKDKEILTLFYELIMSPSLKAKYIITTLEELDLDLMRLKLEDKVSEIRKESLVLTQAEVMEFLKKRYQIFFNEEELNSFYDFTRGIPLFVNVTALKLKEKFINNQHLEFTFPYSEILNFEDRSNVEFKKFLLTHEALTFIINSLRREYSDSFLEKVIQISVLPYINYETINFIFDSSVFELLLKKDFYLYKDHEDHYYFVPFIRYCLYLYFLQAYPVKYQKVKNEISTRLTDSLDPILFEKGIDGLFELGNYQLISKILKKRIKEMFFRVNTNKMLNWLLRLDKNWKQKEIDWIYSYISRAYFLLKKRNEAVEILKEKIPLISDEEALRDAYYNLGNFYKHQHNLSMALESFEKALKIDKRFNNEINMAMDYMAIGVIHDRKGSSSAALLLYKKALKIFQKKKDYEKVAFVLNNMAIIFFKVGEFKEALKLYEKAYKISETIKNDFAKTKLNFNMGAISLYMGKIHKALHYFNKTAKIEERLGLNVSMASTYISIGQAYLVSDNIEIADKYFEMAQELLDIEANFEEERIMLYVFKANIELIRRNLKTAIKYIFNASELKTVLDFDINTELKLYLDVVMAEHALLNGACKEADLRFGNIKRKYRELILQYDFHKLNIKQALCALYLADMNNMQKLACDALRFALKHNCFYWEYNIYFPVYLINVRHEDKHISDYCIKVLNMIGRDRLMDYIENDANLSSDLKQDLVSNLRYIEKDPMFSYYIVKTQRDYFEVSKKQLKKFIAARRSYDFYFNYETGEIRERTQGLINISKRRILYKLLGYLMENAGIKLSLEKIYKNVWKDEFIPDISDKTVKVHISYLRRLIEPSPSSPKYIKTALLKEKKIAYYFEKAQNFCYIKRLVI